MKKNILLFLLLLACSVSQAQIGIGVPNPNASSVLELASTTKGFLPPRMTTAQRNVIGSPVAGLVIYNTTKSCWEWYNGSLWYNGCGNQDVVTGCGAYTAAGVFRVFQCYNLGSTDTTSDPNTPIQGNNGSYYQWGRSTVVATDSTPAAAITSPTWNTTAASDYAWADVTTGAKTANDPCPTGFRVPTKAEWTGVANTALNTVSRTGSWANDGNFTTAVSLGPNGTTKTLTLPAAGYRSSSDGRLLSRGLGGDYWSSAEDVGSANANYLYFGSGSVAAYSGNRTFGFSVRCIAE